LKRFNLKELNYAEAKTLCQNRILLRLANLEILDDNVEINRDLESIRENIETSAKENLSHYELKLHKLVLDKLCLKLGLLRKRKQTKLQ
jgi:hypothetical protein